MRKVKLTIRVGGGRSQFYNDNVRAVIDSSRHEVDNNTDMEQ